MYILKFRFIRYLNKSLLFNLFMLESHQLFLRWPLFQTCPWKKITVSSVTHPTNTPNMTVASPLYSTKYNKKTFTDKNFNGNVVVFIFIHVAYPYISPPPNYCFILSNLLSPPKRRMELRRETYIELKDNYND